MDKRSSFAGLTSWVPSGNTVFLLILALLLGVLAANDHAQSGSGSITGTVTSSIASLPLSGVGIRVSNATGSQVYNVATNASGMYTVAVSTTGPWYVKTVNNLGYIDELYNDVPCVGGTCEMASGSGVSVTAGLATGGIDFVLTPGGTIAGTVTDAGSSAPLANVPVTVHSATGVSLRSATTNGSGQYSISGLATGLSFVRTVTTQNYLNEIYADQPCSACGTTTSSSITVPAGATAVPVTAGATTSGIDFGLAAGGAISGTVTDAGTTAPRSGVAVYVYNSSGTFVGSATTNSSGVYTKAGLAAGSYYARTVAGLPYFDEVYDNLPSSTLPTSGTPITVSIGGVTTANFALAAGATGTNDPASAAVLPLGTTEGLITTGGLAADVAWYKFFVPPENAGQDLKVNVRVTSPYPLLPPSGWRSDLDFALLDGALAFKAVAISGTDNETLYLHNVASGWYYINIPYCTTSYADSTTAARYSITMQTGTGFGVGYITGRVVDGIGDGLAQVAIQVYKVPQNHNITFATVMTDASGYFSIATTPEAHDLFLTGESILTTPEVNVVSEFYANKSTVATADHINVVEGETVAVGDIAVDVGAIITGQVTIPAGTPLANATVYSYDLAGISKSYTRTDANGNYTLMRVPVGGAKLRFSGGSYALEYYDDQPSLGSGATLATQPGVTISGVNAQLNPGGTISGTVKDAQGAPLSVQVWLYSVLDSTFTRATATTSATTGAFSFTAVKPGDYKIFFNTTGTGYAPEWYSDRLAFSEAAVVSVASGGTTSGINAILGLRAGAGDFTGDRKADVLWRHATGGDMWLWPMDGAARTAEAYVRTVSDGNWEIRAMADFDGDGKTDLFWRNKTTGQLYFWPMNGTTALDEVYAGTVDPAYDIVGSGDFNGDGKADLLWRHTTLGDVWVWLMNGGTAVDVVFIDRVDPAYVVKGVGDLDANGKADIVWHHATLGEVWVWPMNGPTRLSQVWVGTVPDTGYQIQGLADFDGNGKVDLLWWHATRGEVWLWTMNGTVRQAETWVGTVPDTTYQIAGTGDHNGDGKADVLWRNTGNGEVWVWLMNGPVRVSETWVATVPDVGYRIIR